MNEELKNFINENIVLINKDTKESWEEIYSKISSEIFYKINGEFTKIILDAGINDPAKILGYIPKNYLSYSKIKYYSIPNSVTSIGDSAFEGCDNLTSTVIGDSVTSIGDHAFNGCRSLIKIVIPDNVMSIGFSAFFNCDSLTSVVIGDGVTSIGEYAFYSCDSLTSVELGESVTSIGSSAFSGCESLKEINYKGTKKQAITNLKVKDKTWRINAAIEKIICTDGEIIL